MKELEELAKALPKKRDRKPGGGNRPKRKKP
jgi:hypothetical protein